MKGSVAQLVVRQIPALKVLKRARENEETRDYTARRRYLEVWKWARANGRPWDEETCPSAAQVGHLEMEMLKWTRSTGCPWDDGERATSRLERNTSKPEPPPREMRFERANHDASSRRSRHDTRRTMSSRTRKRRHARSFQPFRQPLGSTRTSFAASCRRR